MPDAGPAGTDSRRIVAWARTAAGSRALVVLVAAGTGLSALVALSTARIQSRGARALLGEWGNATGSLASWLPAPRDFRGLLVAAVLGLTACWVAVAALVAARKTRPRWAAAAAAAWAAPFALLPPVLSRDAYAYLAQGEVLRRGLDAYQVPVAALGRHSLVLSATDPLWRHSIPPYGALALRLAEGATALGGSTPVVGLVALRLLALAAVVAAAWACVALVRPRPAGLTLWLAAASPLALLHLVGGMHWEALTCALVAGALLLARRGRRLAALLPAVLATELKVTAAVVVLALLVDTLRVRGWLAGARHALVAAVLGLALPLLAGLDPFGWARGLATPAAVWNPLTPSTTLAMAALESLEHLGAGPVPHLLGTLRALSSVAAAVVALVVLATTGRRELTATVGLLLADVALLGPVLWPWYLVPAALFLSVSADPPWRRLGVGLTCASVLFTLPLGVVVMQRYAVADEVAVLAVVLVLSGRFRRRGRGPEPALSLAGAPGREGAGSRVLVHDGHVPGGPDV